MGAKYVVTNPHYCMGVGWGGVRGGVVNKIKLAVITDYRVRSMSEGVCWRCEI